MLNTNRHRIATAFALRLHSMSKAEAEPSFVLPGVKELTLVKRPEGSRERHSAPFNFRFKVTVCTDSTCEPTSISISNGNTLKISKKQNFVLEFSVRHLGDWGRGKCCSWGPGPRPPWLRHCWQREKPKGFTLERRLTREDKGYHGNIGII